MIDNFTFLSPYTLLLLPLFILLNYLSQQKQLRYYMPHVKFLHTTLHKPTSWRTWLKWMMLTSTVLALSMPVYSTLKPMAKKNAIDIVLALDISGSMSLYGFNPKDYKQTRLDAVKEVVNPFISKRKDDRIGLVVFGTHAAIASPLSFERKMQKRIVQGLNIGSLGKSTALIDAVIFSVKLLKKSEAKSKVIILLSDGEDSSSKTPLVMAQKLLKKYQIKIYTIIIDKTHSNMMAQLSKSASTTPYIAKTKENLNTIYTQINKLEKSTVKYHTIKLPVHLYAYFLVLALLCGLTLLASSKSEVF